MARLVLALVLAIFLGAAQVAVGQEQFQCYSSADCRGTPSVGEERPGDCCAEQGLSYRTGDGLCTNCFSLDAYCSQGKEFYLAFFNNLRLLTITRANLRLSVGSVDASQGSFEVESRAGNIIRRDVTFPEEVLLPTDLRLDDESERNAGVFVKTLTDDGLSVVALTEELGSSETFRVLPCLYQPDMFYEYYILSVATNVDPGYLPVGEGTIAIVPSEDNTAVMLNLTQTVDISGADDITDSNFIVKGEEVSLTLNRMQTLYLEDIDDLSGSRVVSNKPLAVMSGHECGTIPGNLSFCDHLVEQLPPTATWGRTFITGSIDTRLAGDSFKVVASRARTTLRSSCLEGSVTLESPGDVHEFNTMFNSSCWFEASEPVLLAQFSQGSSSDGNRRADPFMVLIPPLEQYRSSYYISTFTSQALSGRNYLNILVEAPRTPVDDPFDPRGVLINNEPVDPQLFIPAQCPSREEICGYTAVVELDVGNRGYRVTHTSTRARFNVIAYWFSTRTGHGYFGGMNQKPIALPWVSMQTEAVSFPEDAPSPHITLERSGDLSVEANVSLQLVPGSAGVGTDFQLFEGGSTEADVFFDVGQTSQNVSLSFVDDIFPENNETFEVLLTASPGVFLSPLTRTVVTIYNEDADLPVMNVSLARTSLMVVEGAGVVEFVLRKTAGAVGPVSVRLQTFDGTARGGVDFAPVNMTVTFQIADEEIRVMTLIIDNDDLEPVEEFTVTITAEPDIFPIAVVENGTGTVQIRDNDLLILSLGQPSYTVIEGSSVLVTLELVYGRLAENMELSVLFNSASGTASADEDYTSVSTNRIINRIQMSTSVLVSTVDDNKLERNESFSISVSLGEEQSSVFILPSTSEILISNNDELIIGVFVGSATVSDSVGSVAVTVRVVSGEVGEAVMVGLSAVGQSATDGQDFIGFVDRRIVLTSDRQEDTVFVTIISNEDIEDETFVLLISMLSCQGQIRLAPSSAQVTILGTTPPPLQCFPVDDCSGNGVEAPSLEDCCGVGGGRSFRQGDAGFCLPCIAIGFAEREYTLREGARYNLSVVVERELSLPLDLQLSVEAVPGNALTADFNLLTSEVTLTRNSPTAVVVVEILEEVQGGDEPRESFELRLVDRLDIAPNNVFLRSSVVTILDNVVNIGFAEVSYTTVEGEDFEVNLMAIGIRTTSVRVQVLSMATGTARAGEDFGTVLETVTIALGDTLVPVTVPIVDDAVVEEDGESFSLLVVAIEGAISLSQSTTTIGILDNDRVTLQFARLESPALPESERITLRVVAVGETRVPITVEVSVREGSATDPEDFTRIDLGSDTIVLEPGVDVTAELEFEAATDDLVEGVESFSVFLILPDSERNAVLSETQSVVTVEIADGDAARVGFVQREYRVNETDGSIEVCAQLDGQLSPVFSRIVATVIFRNGTATEPADYVRPFPELVFTAGDQPDQQRGCIDITIVPDGAFEALQEDFSVGLESLFFASEDERAVPPRYLVGDVGSTIVFIRDEDEIVLSLEQESFTAVTEGDTVEVCVRLSRESVLQVDTSINVQYVPGTIFDVAAATTPSDFLAPDTVIALRAGSTRACVVISIVDDDIFEVMEGFSVNINMPPQPRIAVQGSSRATVFISDDDLLPVSVAFEESDYAATEGRPLELCAVLDSPPQAFISYRIVAISGTAVVDEDFSLSQSSLSFSLDSDDPGRRCFNITISADLRYEATEAFMVQLLDGETAIIEAATNVTIEDTTVVSLGFVNESTVFGESDGIVALDVHVLSEAVLDVPIILTFFSEGSARVGEDYQFLASQLTFSPRSRIATLNVSIVDDELVEAMESFFIGFNTDAPRVESPGHFVIITDNDFLQLSFRSAEVIVQENDGQAMVCLSVDKLFFTGFRVTLNSGSATAGSGIDLTAQEVVVNFELETRTACANFVITDDSQPDCSNETIIVTIDTMSLPSFVRTEVTTSVITVIDNELCIQFERPIYFVTEQSAPVTIEVCVEAIGRLVQNRDFIAASSDSTAMTPVDYSTFTQDVRLGPSLRRVCIEVTINGDSIPEDTESFTIQLLGEDFIPISKTTITINDDDSVLTCYQIRDCGGEVLEAADAVECCRVRERSYSMSGSCLQCTVSTKASRFYLGFMQFPALVGNASGEVRLVLTTDESDNVTVDITTQIGFMQTAIVSPAAPTTVNLPVGVRVEDAYDRRKGIGVTAANGRTISVVGLNSQPLSSAAYQAIPCDALPMASYEFYAVSTNSSAEANSSFLVVACTANTTVSFTPTQVVDDPATRGRAILPNTTATVVLQAGETLYVQSADDLTGSRVVADGPVSFFSGHECGNVLFSDAGCDHMVEQIPPTSTWGNIFFVTAVPGRQQGVGLVKVVIGNVSNTFELPAVFEFCDESGSLNELDFGGPGSSLTFNSTRSNSCLFFSRSNALLVVQFTPETVADGLQGDPFMALVPPVLQYSDKFTFPAQNGLFNSFVSTFVPTDFYDPARITLNRETITSWIPLNFGDNILGYYSTALVEPGIHRLQHEDSGAVMFATVYGLSLLDGYAHTAGLELSIRDEPVVNFSSPTYTVAEGSAVNVSVVRSGNVADEALVNITVVFSTRPTEDIVVFRNNLQSLNMDPLVARLNVAVTALPGSAGARVELLLSSRASSPGVFTTNITPVVVAPSRAVIIITGLEL